MKYLLILFTCISFGQFNPIFFNTGASNPVSISFLDAANVSSYPGTGALWTDLKGLQNGTLNNSFTFNSSNGGSIQFNGLNSGSWCSMGSAFNFTTQDFSISIWVFITSLTTNSSGQGPVLFFKGKYNTSGYYCQVGSLGDVSFFTNGPAAAASGAPSGTVSAGNWYNITIVKKGSVCRVYVNGLDKTLVFGVHGNITSSVENFSLAAYNPTISTDVHSNIRIAKFQVYNKALIQKEVMMNFNTYRSVYGL